MKHPKRSWTIWFNAWVPIIIPAFANQIPVLQPILTPTVYLSLLFIVGVANLILRAKTKEGLSLK